jgi:hypothetical protein
MEAAQAINPYDVETPVTVQEHPIIAPYFTKLLPVTKQDKNPMSLRSRQGVNLKVMGLTAVISWVVWLHPVLAQLQFAPPSFEMNGRMAAPVDFQKLQASVVFDLDAKRASAEAIVTFRMGPDKAMPVFDLRQDVREIELDGQPIEPNLLVSSDPPGLLSTPEVNQSMQVLQVVLEAASEHQLRFKYDLSTPRSIDANGPIWKVSGVEWGSWMSELRPGRFLEQWFPANLIHDQFVFELQLKVITAKEPIAHELVTNGTITKPADGTWAITFPDYFSAFSPLVVLVPMSEIEKSTSEVLLENGQVVELEVFRHKEGARVLPGTGKIDPPELPEIHEATARCLKKFNSSFGPWPHGSKCTLFVHDGFEGMEYDGAFTTSALLLPEELLHSFFARGLKPASQIDSWIDEAFVNYYLKKENIYFHLDHLPNKSDESEAQQFYSQYLTEAGQSPLASQNPWVRVTQPGAYRIGVLFFEQLAAIIGEDELDTTMRELAKEHGIANPITTAELEARLLNIAGSRRDDVQKLFSFTVYADTSGDVKEIFKDVIAKYGLDK